MNTDQKQQTSLPANQCANAGYTPEQQTRIDEINKMGHYEMASLWRFAVSGHLYFDKTLPYADIFKKRLFDHFGGFTTEISKSLG